MFGFGKKEQVKKTSWSHQVIDIWKNDTECLIEILDEYIKQHGDHVGNGASAKIIKEKCEKELAVSKQLFDKL